VKDKEGNCEPDGFLMVIDAMGAKEFCVEVKDFKKYQTGITNARRKADILMKNPEI
jgi:hypothetical protein